MKEKKHLVRFIETSKAFDNNTKINAILFVTGAKPNTYIRFKVKKNLHDKHEFERLLKLNNLVFSVSRAKGFEEIVGIKKNAAVWRIMGTWCGYDLFRNEKERNRFDKYVSLVKKQKHKQADTLAGSIYGYPSCCIRKFIVEHNAKALPKKYSYYQYYKKLHDSDKAFPFISHTPCSAHCKKSKALNRKYAAVIKKWAPRFYQKYSGKRTYTVPVIVDLENELGVWKKKDGHDYSVITKRPVEGKYYLISWLTKAKFKRGTVLLSKITFQYDYATVLVKKKIGEIKNFHHKRKFVRP